MTGTNDPQPAMTETALGDAGTPGPALSWQQERLQIKRAEAQIREEQRNADEARRRQRLHADAERHQQLLEARTAARAARRAGRAETLSALGEWLADHMTDLMFVPVIAVPGWLSWDAMSAFGVSLYSGPGHFLPVLSETAMWIFEFAITRNRKKDPDAVVWPLYLGMILFAIICGTLNFAHGVNGPIPGSIPPGIGVGAVYALISVSGIIAHQMVAFGGRKRKAGTTGAGQASPAGRGASRQATTTATADRVPAKVPGEVPAKVPGADRVPAKVPGEVPAKVPGAGEVPAKVPAPGRGGSAASAGTDTESAQPGRRHGDPAAAGFESPEAVIAEMTARPAALMDVTQRPAHADALAAEFLQRTGKRMTNKEMAKAMRMRPADIPGIRSDAQKKGRVA